MKKRVHWRRSGIIVVISVLIIAGCATTDEAAEGTAAVADGEATASVEKEGWSAEITEAIRAKDAPRLERLLASDAYDVNALGERSGYMSVALTVAQEDEEAGIALMDVMIDAGVDLGIGAEVTRDGTTEWLPITDLAVSAGEFTVAYHLAAAGADVTELEESTVTVLMILAALNDTEPYDVATALLEEEPNAAASFMYDDGTRVSALLAATRDEKWPIAEGLLDLPTMTPDAVNYVDRRGTALMHTSFAGNDAVAAQLLEAGADPNVTAYGNFSALMLATLNEHVEVVRRLLAAGADAEVENDNGDSARELAAETGNEALIALFEG